LKGGKREERNNKKKEYANHSFARLDTDIFPGRKKREGTSGRKGLEEKEVNFSLKLTTNKGEKREK